MNYLDLILPCPQCIRLGIGIANLNEQLHDKCNTPWRIYTDGTVKCGNESCNVGTLHLQDIPITCEEHIGAQARFANISEAIQGLQFMSQLRGQPGIPNDIDEFAKDIWDNLDQENKISLYVSYVDIITKQTKSVMINKYSK